jgi:type II secretory pathway component PulJ
MRRRSLAGFTLLEVLAVVLLTSVVIGAALRHYVNLSRASERAMQHTRGVRRATAILDRLARDLEGTLLFTKEPETDPLDHPWLFYGESRYSETGADQLKFTTRSHRPGLTTTHESDLAVVAYALRRGEDGGFEPMRWSSAHLPAQLDREVPDEESQGAVLLADDLADFAVHFVDEAGNSSSSWDSSQLADSSALPIAVDIEVALASTGASGDETPERYRRRAVLALRPIDIQELMDPTSLVSGGNSLGPGEDEEFDDEGGTAACAAGPCGTMSACEAIDCAGKKGTLTPSTDLLFEKARGQSYCSWMMGISRPMLRSLLVNPACL